MSKNYVPSPSFFKAMLLTIGIGFGGSVSATGLDANLRKLLKESGRIFADWKTQKDVLGGYSLESYRTAEQAFQVTLDEYGADPALTVDLYEGGRIYRFRALLSSFETSVSSQSITLSIGLPPIRLDENSETIPAKLEVSIPDQQGLALLTIRARPFQEIVFGQPAVAKHVPALDKLRDKNLIKFLEGHYSTSDTLDMATLVRQRLQPKDQWLGESSGIFREEEQTLAQQELAAQLKDQLQKLEGFYVDSVDGFEEKPDRYRIGLDEREGETYFVIKASRRISVNPIFEAPLSHLIPKLGEPVGDHFLRMQMDKNVQSFGNEQGQSKIFINTYAPYRVLIVKYAGTGGGEECALLLRAPKP